MSGRSLIRPSTPQSSSRRMSSASLTVQTWTATPVRAHVSRNGARPPASSRTFRHLKGSFGGLRTGQWTQDRYSASRVSSREAPVRMPVRSRAPRGGRACRTIRARRARWRRRADLVDCPLREDGIVDLQLDDERRRRVALQHLLQRRHAPPARETDTALRRRRGSRRRSPAKAARSESRHPAARAHRRSAPRSAAAVRGPIQRRVVVHDDDPVARQMDVELQPVGAERQPVIEGEERVLRPKRRPAAMRENLWSPSARDADGATTGNIQAPDAPWNPRNP